MKKLMLLMTLSLVGCSKPPECMHIHMGGMMLEVCSKNVQCTESREGSDTMKICQYVEPTTEEKK